MKPYVTLFEQVALGEVSAKEALGLIRGVSADSDKALGQRLYIALKAVTMRRLTGRRTDESSAWVDVIRQSSSLLKARGDELFGERLLVLSDMTSDWARTCEVHDFKDVVARPYVVAILKALHEAGGKAKRAAIVEAARVGDSNLSRILGTLEGHGLLTRDKLKERTVTLTEEGARLAREVFDAKAAKPVEYAPLSTLARSVEVHLADLAVGYKDATYNHFPFRGPQASGGIIDLGRESAAAGVVFCQPLHQWSFPSVVNVTSHIGAARECNVFSTQGQAVEYAKGFARPRAKAAKVAGAKRYRRGDEASRD